MKKLLLALALILALTACGEKKAEKKVDKKTEEVQEYEITKSEIISPSKYVYVIKDMDPKTTNFLDFDRNESKVSYTFYAATDYLVSSNFRTEDSYIFVENKDPDSEKIDHKFKLERISNKEFKLIEADDLEWKIGSIFSLEEENIK